MRTQQGFYKNKTPQNIRVINSNFNNIYKNVYNNYMSINKYNTLHNINNNNRKNNNELLSHYSSRKYNAENEYKYYLKSQNYFSKDFKSISNNHRNNRDYSISPFKNPHRTNINFFLSNNDISNFKNSKDNKNSKKIHLLYHL